MTTLLLVRIGSSSDEESRRRGPVDGDVRHAGWNVQISEAEPTGDLLCPNLSPNLETAAEHSRPRGAVP